MLSRIEAENISYVIKGFNASTGFLEVCFTNPYGEGHLDHDRYIRPVIDTDENDNPVFNQSDTDIRILEQRSGVAEKMWLDYKRAIEKESSVGDALGALFGVVETPVVEEDIVRPDDVPEEVFEVPVEDIGRDEVVEEEPAET